MIPNYRNPPPPPPEKKTIWEKFSKGEILVPTYKKNYNRIKVDESKVIVPPPPKPQEPRIRVEGRIQPLIFKIIAVGWCILWIIVLFEIFTKW